jgi:hypothetical protein
MRIYISKKSRTVKKRKKRNPNIVKKQLNNSRKKSKKRNWLLLRKRRRRSLHKWKSNDHFEFLLTCFIIKFKFNKNFFILFYIIFVINILILNYHRSEFIFELDNIIFLILIHFIFTNFVADKKKLQLIKKNYSCNFVFNKFEKNKLNKKYIININLNYMTFKFQFYFHI